MNGGHGALTLELLAVSFEKFSPSTTFLRRKNVNVEFHEIPLLDLQEGVGHAAADDHLVHLTHSDTVLSGWRTPICSSLGVPGVGTTCSDH